ncbi:uncharacterized protein LOC133328026 [Musca vetustissima]|uniref:uncharacterized protein LOC133328026 n=1 Tax=Musca vetustissima TaxID=27455 RepID=UPI002AB6BB14|nr:uncharacterized protein LOC133328026 [Musca vetustissima]
MQDESISSSPSSSTNKSIRNARTLRKKCRRNLNKNVETSERSGSKEENLQFLYYDSEGKEEDMNKTFVVTSSLVTDYIPFEMETLLMQADRQSLKPKTVNVPPINEEFQTCQRLVETEFREDCERSRDKEKSFFITESELLNCCNEADQILVVESTPNKSLRLVNSILEDFALSPFTTKSLETSTTHNWEYSPQFILKQKPEKTYCRRKQKKMRLSRRLEFNESASKADDKVHEKEEEDCLSNGSSAMSIQEISQTEEDEDILNTTNTPDLSERVGGNLLNLTTFFTQENSPGKQESQTSHNNVALLQQDIDCMRLVYSQRSQHLNSYNSDEDFLGFPHASEDEISLPSENCEEEVINKTLVSPQSLQMSNDDDREMNCDEEDDDVMVPETEAVTKPDYQENWYDDGSDLLAMIRTQEVLYQKNEFLADKATSNESTDLNTNQKIATNVGFKTASAKPIHISKEAEMKALEICQNLPELNMAKEKKGNMFNEKTNIANMGFQTASAKPINISKEAEIKALEICQNLPELNMTMGFQTASAKPIHITREAEMKAFEICKNLPELKPLSNSKTVDKNKNCDIGFKTASANPILISKEAQMKALELLKDLPEIDSKEEKLNSNSIGFQTAAGNGIQVSKKAKTAVANLLKEFQADMNFDKSLDDGFRTAGGKKLQISEKAKNSVANLLREFQSSCDFNDCEQNLEELKTKLQHKNQELKNKNTKTSNQENEKINNLQDVNNTDLKLQIASNGLNNCQLNGFQTAGGKKINISAKAKKAVASLLKDFQDTNESNFYDYEKCLSETKNKLQARNCELKSMKQYCERNSLKENTSMNTTLSLIPSTSKQVNLNVDTPTSIMKKGPECPLTSPINNLTTKSISLNNCDNTALPSTSKRPLDNVSTPLPPSKRIQQSFSELSMQSPLTHHSTTKSLISRKNLLSLSKKRKQRKHSSCNNKIINNLNDDMEQDNEPPKNLIGDQQIKTPLKTKSLCTVNSPWTPNVNEFFKNAPTCSTPRLNAASQHHDPHHQEMQEDFKTITWEEANNSVKPTKLLEECGSNITLNTSSTPPSVNDRIGRLKMYGEAPAITPIDITNNCRPSGLRRTRRKITKNNSTK